MDEKNDGSGANGQGAGSGTGGALDRYLNQSADAASPATEKPAAADTLTSASRPDLNLNLSAVPATKYSPAGFWRRFFAYLIDAAILGIFMQILLIPMRIVFPLTFPDQKSGVDFNSVLKISAWAMSIFSITTVVALVFGAIYYGWFYSQKGGTPGKLALDLRVINRRTGLFLTYKQAFLRDCLAKKYVSSLFTLGIGYLMAGFRDDKRALHDLMCDTQVVKVEK